MTERRASTPGAWLSPARWQGRGALGVQASDTAPQLSVVRDVTTAVAVAAAYFLTAKFGLSLAFATKQVTAVWPPTGLAFAVLALFGYRVWPGIFVGAFFANATAHESA